MLYGTSAKKEEIKYKVKYAVNNLSNMESETLTIMEILCETNNLDIFKTESVSNLIDFKWNKFSKYIHYNFAIIHFAYVISLIFYVNLEFIYHTHTLKT